MAKLDKDIEIIPFGKRILIELPNLTIRAKGGIVLPAGKGDKKKAEGKAKVVKFGTGWSKAELPDLKIGDKILFYDLHTTSPDVKMLRKFLYFYGLMIFAVAGVRQLFNCRENEGEGSCLCRKIIASDNSSFLR